MSKKLWIILGIAAVLLVGFLLFRGDSNDNQTGNDAPTGEALHVRGNPSSNVILTEYSDFQCPYCAAYYPVVEQVIDKYQKDIKFEYRHLPLVSKHPNAFAASRAAEAAGLQSDQAFWDMSSLLFENQQAWSESSSPQPIFEQFAQQLNLDIEKFKTDFASSKVNDRINADIAAFKATGAEMSTPTFLLNGEKIILSEGTLEEFSKHIDAALAEEAKKEPQPTDQSTTE